MNYKSDLELVQSLQDPKEGTIQIDSKHVNAQIAFENGAYLLLIDDILEFDTDGITFSFSSKEVSTNISATITAHRNSINTERRLASQYSECKVYSFEDKDWKNDAAFYRSFLSAPKHLIYNVSGNPHRLKLVVNNVHINLYQDDQYIIIENETAIDYEKFSETTYNVLVALGFVSGKFVQDEVYTLYRTNKDSDNHKSFKYRKLRKGFSSIYHAVTGNPFGYKYFIGESLAEKLYKMKTLTYLDTNTISKLAELVQNNHQILYALVLFNEANSNELSLLIKNNCFFAVMEVLKKYFHDVFKSQLPKDYSQQGNIEKFRLVFECLFAVSKDELSTIGKRNVFMHGDINNLEGKEMVAIMQKQITLIYKIILTFVGFDGYIIDHYSIRNHETDKAFIKLN